MDLSGTKVNELVSINFICKNAEVREFKTNLGVSDSPLRNGSYSLPVSKCLNIKAQIFFDGDHCLALTLLTLFLLNLFSYTQILILSLPNAV